MPDDAGRMGYSEVYTGADAYKDDYINGVGRQIGELIRSIGVDRFDRSAMRSFEQMADEEWKRTVHLPSVLWQNGLLGFVDRHGRHDLLQPRRRRQLPRPGRSDLRLPPLHDR